MVDKVKGGVKRGCVHFDTPSRYMGDNAIIESELITNSYCQ